MNRENFRDGYVLMLDMLGFKERTADIKSDFIDCWRALKKDIQRTAREMKYGYDIHINTLFLSDTIIICFSLKKNDHCDLNTLLLSIPELIQSFFLKYMEKSGIFFRGALSFGKFIFLSKENIVMGPALNEAAEWYESTDWIGIILTPSAECKLRLIKTELYESIAMYDDFVEYKIPLKPGFPNISRFSIMWIGRHEYRSGDNDVLGRVLRTFASISHSPKYSSKYINTIRYIEDILYPEQD